MKTSDYKTVDEYIATFPPDVQRTLEEIRKTIRSTAPGAKEVISYQMPTYRLNGILLHFAAFQNHYSLFPGPSAIEKFSDELEPYETSKGTIRFPKDKPVPYDLISRIVQHRVEMNMSKVKK